MTDLFPDYVPVHAVPCELDAYDTYLTGWLAQNPGMHGPAFWPGSPCLIQDDMCLTCGGVDPADYDPAFHGPDQSLMARRGRVRVEITDAPPDACGAQPCRNGDHYGQCWSVTASVSTPTPTEATDG